MLVVAGAGTFYYILMLLCYLIHSVLEADGNGYIVIAGRSRTRRGPVGRRLGGEREPSTTAVDRRFDKWATRTSADVSVPRLRYDVPPGFP